MKKHDEYDHPASLKEEVYVATIYRNGVAYGITFRCSENLLDIDRMEVTIVGVSTRSELV